MRGEFYKMEFRAWNMGTVDLTLEQEAAYLRLCHAMYDAGGPVPESTRFLQGLFRCGNVKAAALVQQLVQAGKIARTPDGRLTNARVTKELSDREHLSEIRRSAGGKGGSARRVNAECGSSDGRVNAQCDPSEGEVRPECGSSDPAVTSSKSLMKKDARPAIASTPRSREEKIREDSPIAPKGTEPEGFAEFREAYPRRNTAFPVTDARKRWLEARRRGATAAEIIAGAKAYAAEQAQNGKVGSEFIQTANVWLNRERWKDYAQAALPEAAPPATVSDDKWRERLRLWRSRGGYWPWGCPPPDDPRTPVPQHILDEFGIRHGRPARSLALLAGTG